MRIKSAKRAYTLLHSGIVPTGGLSPKVHSGGKGSSNDELMWELAIITSPCKHLDELTQQWAEYVYTENPKEERLSWLKQKICIAVDDYSLSFVDDLVVEKFWKITRLNEFAVEDFRESERRSKRLYTEKFYYSSIGMGSSNYYNYWKERVDEVNTYLDCLTRRALSPVAARISELEERERLDEAV